MGGKHGFFEGVLHVKLFQGKIFKHFGESAGLSSEISFFLLGKQILKLGKHTKCGMRYLGILARFSDSPNTTNFPGIFSGFFFDEIASLLRTMATNSLRIEKKRKEFPPAKMVGLSKIYPVVIHAA